ncbi:MAG: molybdopterin-binding protein [Actinomycetota bacterium]|nr:molybdopterin-binding protein [Actinomycetota bacterium]
MTATLRASIIVIGDEILGGFVADTNSGWLAGRFHAEGVPLDRVTTVPDDAAAIDEALSAELARARPRLIITSGGIGSTPDDLTLAAVAASLGRPTTVQPEIDARITRALEWTAARGISVTPAHEQSMRRMARVPDGSYLLTGANGVVPGVAVDVDGGARDARGATVVILPGVPSELRAIYDGGVAPTLVAGRGVPQHVAEVTHDYPESTLNPVLDRIVAEYPDVSCGSYPGRECVIRLKGERDRVAAAMRLVEDYLGELAAQPGSAAMRERWRAYWVPRTQPDGP